MTIQSQVGMTFLSYERAPDPTRAARPLQDRGRQLAAKPGLVSKSP